MFSFKPVLDSPPISACPKCEYDLRAHEDASVCPECGLEYSCRDLVIDTTPAPKRVMFWVDWAVFVSMSAWVVYDEPSRLWSVLFALGFLLMVAVMSNPRLTFVGRWAFRPTGVFHYYRGKEMRHIHWNGVKDLTLGGGRRNGWLIVVKPKWRMHVTVLCGKDSEAAKEMLRLARELWADSSGIPSTS